MIFILLVIILILVLYGAIQAGVHEGEHLFDFEPLTDMFKHIYQVITDYILFTKELLMEQRGYKEVYFDNFCATCENGEVNEHFDPCNECLEYGAREGTHKPLHYKEKEKK